MFSSSFINFLVLATSLATAVQGAPVRPVKRIAQTIADSTAKWEQACIKAGGGEKCNPVSVTAFTTLLAAAGPCEQQDSGDAMIDLAKTLNNDPQMIKLTQIFAQQPRNTPNSVAVPYCQKAPKNPELKGLFQCQFQGADQKNFVGGVAVGGEGTIPFGQKAPLDPAGSCPANPKGPIADGSQLSDITQDPGVGSVSGGSKGSSSSGSKTTSTPSKSASASDSAATATASSGSNKGGKDSGDFKLQNGKDAQHLNARFSIANPNEICTDGVIACVNNGLAKCVKQTFKITKCGASQICAAVPLTDKAGTDVLCTTKEDAEAKIAATGVKGGLDGSEDDADSQDSSDDDDEPAQSTGSDDSGSSTDGSDEDSSASTSTSASASSASAPASGDFHLKNGQDAQKLNAKFATLDESSPCTVGEDACINGGFAQCVGDKFAIQQCAAGTTCAALPLVNKAGTSLACTTEADAVARIAATGAKGGIAG